MAVYKEGWRAVEAITKRQHQIFGDAADFGALFVKGDDIWKEAATAAAFYGLKETRKVDKYLTGKDAQIDFELMAEFGPNPEKTTRFRLTVVIPDRGVTTGWGNRYDGYMTVEEVR